MQAQFHRRDTVSHAGGRINADRCGSAGAYAWVIDGATDVATEPLMPGGSDAAWFATIVDRYLASCGEAGDSLPLPELLAAVTAECAAAFARDQQRQPNAVHEHPSAAAIFVRLCQGDDGPMLEALSLADCQLIVEMPGKSPILLGDPELEAGDRRVVAAITDYRNSVDDRSIGDVRKSIWPLLQLARDRLNQPDGYAALSVLPVPEHFIRVQRVAAPIGTRLLLATDGFTRLSDVFSQYRTEELMAEAERHGLPMLLETLRRLERDDADCRRFHRTKTHDDATALLLEITAAD